MSLIEFLDVIYCDRDQLNKREANKIMLQVIQSM